MKIKNIAYDFSSVKEFLDRFGSFNPENTELNILNQKEILLKNKNSNNSLSFTLFRNKSILLPGRTYTISCDFVIKEKIKKTLPFDVPKIAFDCIINNKNYFDYKSSLSIPNEVGVWHKYLTIQVPENCSEAWFRIHAGIEKDAGELIVKNIFVSENDFDFIYFDNLFLSNSDHSYSLMSFKTGNYTAQIDRISYLFRNKKFNFLNAIIKNVDDNSIKLKLEIYNSLLSDNVKKVKEHFEKIKEYLNEDDAHITCDILYFFAEKLEWDISKDIASFFDNKGMYIDHPEYLYSKSQIHRRFQCFEKETECYNKALSLDKNKVNIDWGLFFDKYNPGLSYRREELKFIIDNLPDIQKIANTYTPIDINFTDSPIFVFWDQGYDYAPQIVKVMIDRMKKIYGSNLVFLNEGNLDAYIDIPSGIAKFRENRRAFFSDYIRTDLLLKYGGTWVDATTFITNQFYQETKDILGKKENNFYVLRIPENPYRISSWFLSTNQINNRILALMYAALLIFAEKKDDIYEYYQYHSFFEILTQLDKIAYDDFKQNYKDNYQPYSHDILKNFRNDWDKELFNKLLLRCPIQKLTYRSNLLHLRTQSFYKTILRNGVYL